MDPLRVLENSDRTRLEQTTQKLPLTMHDTPRSVDVIDADRIREQGFRTPVDTLYYTPGVFPNSTAAGSYHYISRGYRMSPNETLLDGFQGFYVGGGQSALSLYGVERVVTLRGPAGLLYGAATLPGGLINIITKKPSATSSTRLDLTSSTFSGLGVGFGDRATWGAEFDSTGPLTNDGRWLYRTILAGDDSDHYTAGAVDRTRYTSASLTYLLDAAGKYRLTPLVQWSRNDRAAGSALVISPTTSLSTNDGRTGPIDEAALSPFDVNLHGGGRRDEILVAGFDFRGEVNEDALIEAAYRFNHYETSINQWTPQAATLVQVDPADPRSWVIRRAQSKSETERESHHVDFRGTYAFTFANGWDSRLQAGINARFYESDARTATGPNAPQSAVNLYTGRVDAPLQDVLTTWGAANVSEETHWNAYLQDQLALPDGRWVATAGLGYGQQHYRGAPTRKGDVTPNFGLLFHATPSLALYASYSTSYQPADPTLEDRDGRTGTLGSQTGENFEVGAKLDRRDGRASLALSVFDTRRDAVLVQSNPDDLNPNGNRYYTLQSGQRAQGAEFSGSVLPRTNWRVTGTFAYLDASYESGPFPTPVAKTPRTSWSVFTRYDFEAEPLQKLGVSAGIVWQDERLAGNAARSAASPDPLTLPSFTRVDTAIYYQLTPQVDLALHVNNAFDERIFVDGTTGANLQVAAPRSFTLRVGYQF